MMTGAYIRGEETSNFNFYTNLSTAQKLKIVNSVVSLVVDESNYHSIIRDLIMDFYIVDIFTDVDTKEIKESLFFVNDVEQFLEETNIVDIVKANMEDGLLDELNSAIDKSIEYKTGIHPSPLSDALSNLINTLEKKVSEFDMDDMMGMAQKFVGMAGELTPESVVNAYINSDIHKNNVEEIVKSKVEKAESDKVVIG